MSRDRRHLENSQIESLVKSGHVFRAVQRADTAVPRRRDRLVVHATDEETSDTRRPELDPKYHHVITRILCASTKVKYLSALCLQRDDGRFRMGLC